MNVLRSFLRTPSVRHHRSSASEAATLKGQIVARTIPMRHHRSIQCWNQRTARTAVSLCILSVLHGRSTSRWTTAATSFGGSLGTTLVQHYRIFLPGRLREQTMGVAPHRRSAALSQRVQRDALVQAHPVVAPHHSGASPSQHRPRQAGDVLVLPSLRTLPVRQHRSGTYGWLPSTGLAALRTTSVRHHRSISWNTSGNRRRMGRSVPFRCGTIAAAGLRPRPADADRPCRTILVRHHHSS